MKSFLTVTDTINSKNIDLSSSVILHNADCFRLYVLSWHHWSDSVTTLTANDFP